MTFSIYVWTPAKKMMDEALQNLNSHVSSLHDDAWAHWPKIIFNFQELDQ